MKISVSTLNLKEPRCEELTKIDLLDVDYIHVDIMDGIFVENKTLSFEEAYDITKFTKKPKDIHLMVSNVKKYIDEFSSLDPEFITFHYEAASDLVSVINYIHNLGIKAGVAINPNTSISEIANYLDCIDLVLVMSVEPGRGGQVFIEDSVKKIEQLYILRETNNYNYVIEVDGGVNDNTIKKCSRADICVVGTFITKNNYNESIKKLRDY